MKQYDKLYALDKKGKIRSFEIKVEVPEFGVAVIWSKTGLLDGKKVTRMNKVISGKQKRNYEEQAEFQAKADWNKKWNEGYKSYNTLAKAYNVGRDTRIAYANNNYEEHWMIVSVMSEIKWNTSNYWTPLPMLAKPYVKEDLSKGYIAQPKLDGVRNITLAKEKSILMCSRGGKFYTGLSHIEKEMDILFKKYPRTQFDGELYTHGVTQNEISGAARKQKRDLFTDYTWLEYHIYDLPIIEGNEHTQDEREAFRIRIATEFSEKLKYIRFIPSHRVWNYEQAKKLHDKYVAEGYEGLILRDPDAPYMFSFRDKCLLKLKAFVTEEFKCVGRACQTGDISTFTLILSNGDGQTFGCRCKGSHALWQRYLDNPPIGQMVKVRYINRSAINNVPEKATVLPLKEYDKWE